MTFQTATATTVCYPSSHTLAAIIEQLEEDNRFLRHELKSVRAELQLYKAKKPIQLDEEVMEQLLNEIIDHKIQANNQQMKPEQDHKIQDTEPKPFIWEQTDHHLRTHEIHYIKDLITKHNIDLNQTDARHHHMTLLMKSCVFGNYDIAELLVHSEADIDLKSEEKEHTALDYAEIWANYHIAQLLQFEDLGASLGSEVKNTINTLHRQNGITQCALQYLSQQTLDEIVGLMRYCVDQKLPFSDDMMHIAWAHINKQHKQPIDSGLFQLLLATYSNIVKDTTNKRDWSWLKHYLTPSTIWLNTYPHDHTRTLFNELFIGADKANKKLSKDLLLESIGEMKKQHLQLWRQLKKFKVNDCVNPMGSNRISVVRQDEIEYGVIAHYTKKELLSNKPHHADFNPIDHYDLNEYLNKLYLRGTIVDETFQSDVFGIIKQIVCEDNSIGVHYKRGPIKLFKRCVAKIEHKYMNEEFPTSAHLLDINRCSLTFHDLPSMTKGIKQLMDIIHSGTTCIKNIVRCKNGWNSTDFVDSSPTYSDIKFNVIIDIGNNIAIIGEIQILLSLMQRFKIRAHPYYNIFRHHDFIQNYIDIAPLMMDIQTQLFVYACNGDSKGLLHFMVTYDISATDLLIPHEKSGKSILSKICDFNHIKTFKLLQTLLTTQQFSDALKLHDTTAEQWSPVGEALHGNSTDIIQLLCTDYPYMILDFHFKNKMRGKHALHFVCQNGNIECLQWYLEQMKDETHEKKKRLLLVEDKYGYTPFLSACNYSQIQIMEYLMQWAAYENLQDIIVMRKDNDGCNTPLQLCCYKGNTDVVSSLLSYVIDSELRLKMILDVDKNGLTSLIYAALSESDSASDCVVILLRYIEDQQQRLEYIQHQAHYNNKSAYGHTRNEELKIQLRQWISAAKE